MKDPLQSGKCSRLLIALADPERLKIVQCLRTGPKDVSELARLVRSRLANVSHHLKVLRRNRFVVREQRGRKAVYSLNPSVVQPGQGFIDLECCRLDLRG